jgi:hypothetical protein
MRRTLSVLAALFISTYALEVCASDKAASAQALFDEARALMARGDYEAACVKLEGSRDLDPGPGTEYNLALCYEKSGRTASAWATYLSAAAAYKATSRPEWETKARDHAVALEGQLGRLTIVVPPDAPPGLTIMRDGAPVVGSALGVAIPVDPGAHVVVARAPDHADWMTRVDVAASAKTVVEIPQTWSRAPAPKVDTGPAAVEARRSPAVWIAGGAGLVALGLGTVAGLVAISKNSASQKDCPNDGVCRSPAALDANDSSRTWGTVSTVSFVAAGAFIATSVVLYFVTTKRTAPAQASLSFRALGGLATW